jgi:hypothetical protein
MLHVEAQPYCSFQGESLVSSPSVIIEGSERMGSWDGESSVRGTCVDRSRGNWTFLLKVETV